MDQKAKCDTNLITVNYFLKEVKRLLTPSLCPLIFSIMKFNITKRNKNKQNNLDEHPTSVVVAIIVFSNY